MRQFQGHTNKTFKNRQKQKQTIIPTPTSLVELNVFASQRRREY